MKNLRDWGYETRNAIASTLRNIAKDAPPIQASYLRELAIAIDNN